MYTISDEIWGIIPARGGSKSIPYKNLITLQNHSLIEYVFRAGARSALDRILCSTEDEKICEHCRQLGLEVHQRPESLAQDETAIIDVLIQFLQDIGEREGRIPLAIALLQPTSPFVLPTHINESISALLADKEANSVQTITEFPHNFHAYNQRVVNGRYVSFNFLKERMLCFNKQLKPKFYLFGNLVITRSEAILKEKNVFAGPSIAIPVPLHYAVDVDTKDDIDYAEFLLEKEKVDLISTDIFSSTGEPKKRSRLLGKTLFFSVFCPFGTIFNDT